MNYIENRDLAGILYKLADVVRVYDDIMSLHDCYDCGKKDCPYRPVAGELVRINCPLWEMVDEESEDEEECKKQ